MINHLNEHIDVMRERAARSGSVVDVPYANSAETPQTGRIYVFDHVLPDPLAYRAMALALEYRSVTVGAVTFHGIAGCQDASIPLAVMQEFPDVTPTLTFFRKSPLSQVEPNYIHTDRDMGDWTALLYLNPDPPEGDGTTFWQHRETDAKASIANGDSELRAEYVAWRDQAQWMPWRTIDAKFNRLLLFSAPLFHSRAILENYGEGEQARLLQCVFGTGSIERARTCV